MSAFIIVYSEIQNHIDALLAAIPEELGTPALQVSSFEDFLELWEQETVLGAVLDFSDSQSSPRIGADNPSDRLAFREWATRSKLPILILSDDADLAEAEPLVMWGTYTPEMSSVLAPLIAPLRQARRHGLGLGVESSLMLVGGSPRQESSATNLDLHTSAVVGISPTLPLSILLIGELPGFAELLRNRFARVIQASQLDEVLSYLRSSRPQAILISQTFDRFECALDTIRMSEVTRHTSVAILGNGSTFAPTLSRSPTLLFQKNTPPAYVVEQLSFGARVALLQTPRLLLIADKNQDVPALVRPDGGTVSRCSPSEISSEKGGVDLVVLTESIFDRVEMATVLKSIRERFGIGTPTLLYSEDVDSKGSEWMDGVIRANDSPEEVSRKIDLFASFSRARSQLSERDDLTGANHWCGCRHALNRRLDSSAETQSWISLIGVEIERFSELLNKHNSMHDTILRYVSDHLWQYFPKPATFRGPEGRFFIISDPVSESNFRKIERHLEAIRSTTLRDPNGHGLYLRLHAAHLRVPPGIRSAEVCLDAIVRMFSRMRVHSGATFLSAELDPELVLAPPEHQGES